MRKISTGAAMPVATGYSRDDGTWQSSLHVVETKTNTSSTSGDTQVVAAPGGTHRIVVTAFCIQNESGTATTMILRAGTSTNGWRCLGQNQGDGLAMSFAHDNEWRLPENTALNFNLSGANLCGYSVSWFVEEIR